MSEQEKKLRFEYQFAPAKYRKTDLSPEKREELVEVEVERILLQLSLEEKISLCHANSKFAIAGIPRLKIKPMWMSDGPHGVRHEIAKDSWESANWKDDHSTALPVLTGVAASFNTEMAILHGTVLGREARHRKKDIILGPGVNIARTPIYGRNFEYAGEDPYLAGKIAAHEIRAIQKSDVAACVKHYALNSQELNRRLVDARPDERTLREIYLPAFEYAIKEGNVWTVMGAFNSYYGTNCNQSKHLNVDILKGEWGFKGVILTDWDVRINTKDAALYGLDIEMGTKAKSYDDYHLANPFLKMLKEGQIPVSVLDDKARRILRVELSVGMMDGNRVPGQRNTDEHRQIARKIAEEAVVLLKNDEQLLPLKSAQIKNLLVLGHNADKKHAPHGGSSEVKCAYEITPLEGLKRKFGKQIKITYIDVDSDSQGFPIINQSVVTSIDPGPGIPSWKVTLFKTNTPVAVVYSVDADVTEEIRRLKGKQFDKVVLSGTIKPEDSGSYQFKSHATGETTTTCDGKAVNKAITLEAGTDYEIAVTYTNFKQKEARLAIGWKKPAASVQSPYLTAAKQADAVIYFGGIDHSHDREGADRPNMRSLDRDIPERLLAVRPDAIMFMIGGSPIEMPWKDDAKAIAWGWYAGMEAGNAFADILFGDVNPSGKLPMSFPKRLDDSPGHALNDYNADHCEYKEGVFVGYRWYEHKKIEPLFPFGHGLSYTTFEYSNITLSSDTMKGDDTLRVTFGVTNTGNVAGKESSQLYIHDVEATVPRPPKELKGFDKVSLAPGESKTIELEVNKRALSFWDVESKDWKAEPGNFNVMIGASSTDIRLSAGFIYEQ